MRLDARAALQCHEFLHKSFAPGCFDLSERAPESEMMRELKRQGDIHEARTIENLMTKNLDILVINKDQDHSQFRALLVRQFFLHKPN